MNVIENFINAKENVVGMNLSVDPSPDRSLLRSGDVGWILTDSVVRRERIDVSQTLEEGV